LRETPRSFSYNWAELTQEIKKLGSKETIAARTDLVDTCVNLRRKIRETTAALSNL
jgi:hypothetical protein